MAAYVVLLINILENQYHTQLSTLTMSISIDKRDPRDIKTRGLLTM